MSDRIDLLIEILFDDTAREDEKHDAVMDIGEFDDDRALSALLKIANNPNEKDIILDSCGESIIQIWIHRNKFDINAYKNFIAPVQNAINAYIQNRKPEWLTFI